MKDPLSNESPDDHGPFPLDGQAFGTFSRVQSFEANAVIEDAYLGDNATDAGDVRTDYIGLAVSTTKRNIFFIALVCLLLAIVLRAWQMQIMQHARYVRQAEENRSRTILVPVERSIIYDRSGTPLVRNVPDFTATLVPDDLPKNSGERIAAIGRLAEILSITPIDIETKLAEFAQYPASAVAIAENLTHEQAVQIRVESARTPAVALHITTRREYLDTDTVESLSHILGFEGRITKSDLEQDHTGTYVPSDLIGKTGIERKYESILRGTYGRKRVEVDAHGREKSVIAEEPGRPGHDLVLSLDLDLQKQAELALRDALRSTGQKRGSVIITKPTTGEILALVSEPAFDANLFAKGISTEDYRNLTENPNNPLFPRAIAASLPAGSVFKMVVAAAALQEHIITPTTSFLSVGGIRVGQWFFPDWKAGGHGITNVTKALAESVNTFFYIVGGGLDAFQGLGVERITAYAKKFGLGSTLGIDLPGEGAGFLPTKQWKEQTKGEKWYIGDTYHFAIGQGDLLVTPLQINAITATIANGGSLMQPHMLNTETADDGTRTEHPPVILNPQVVEKSAVEEVRKGMRATVVSGVARSLGDLPVAVAAKTGTAQWKTNAPTHAWFTSFAPYDKPQLAVTVMIEEGGQGSAYPAQAAKRIYAWYFSKR